MPSSAMPARSRSHFSGSQPEGARELDHYQNCTFTTRLLPGDAFHITRMLEAAPDDRAVLRLARKALPYIPADHSGSGKQRSPTT